jgi:hypothetical protein
VQVHHRPEAAGRREIRVANRRQLDKADIVDVTQMHPVSIFETLCPLFSSTHGALFKFSIITARDSQRLGVKDIECSAL